MESMIKIGTRGSRLALWQANHVADLLGRDKTEIVIIKTKGDKIQNVSFDKMEGKGFFTKEIEDALLAGKIDLAVHSLKDLPTEGTPGLELAAVTEREDPSDVLLVRRERFNQKGTVPLFDGAVVGTSSLRRAAQIRHEMDSLSVQPLRGNVTTRIRRLREGKYDAIILARAGLNRLAPNLFDLTEYTLPFSFFLPAPAQGALALQVRAEDEAAHREAGRLHHEATAVLVNAERHFLRCFGGGCHIPLGALAFLENGMIHLSGVIAAPDGSRMVRRMTTGRNPEEVGEELADLLKEEGAECLV